MSLKPKLIEPRTLKGFRDYPPVLMIPREEVLQTARSVYRAHGFAPIDTPALEYAEVLTGKGGEESDRLIYRFKDHGDRDVALRFDLTVPFARFAALHIPKLGTPFKRYAMGPVWRGENTSHGRYREFWQCDFDTIGTTSNAADIEVALVIHELLVSLGLERFEIRINNRLILNGLLQEAGLAHQSVAVLRALDKLPKVGMEAVLEEMAGHGVPPEAARRVLELASTKGDAHEILDLLNSAYPANETLNEGIRRLRELFEVVTACGLPMERFRLDLAIARGLDYYTGTIYETFLLDLPGIGSICSGGRYDNLAGVYTTQKLPGVGASLGVDRLLTALEELGRLGKKETPAQILVTQFEAASLGHYCRIASLLRKAGLLVEVFPEAKKIGQQLQYAEKRGHPLAVIAGPEELALGSWKLKNLSKRTESSFAEAELAEAAKRELTS